MSGAELSRRSLLGAGAALMATPALAKGADPQVGRFTGLRDDGVLAFKGIRYGRAKRFARAVAVPIDRTVKAQDFAPIAPQRGNPDLPQSEDCLFLNVWTPEANPKASRAVMVYFHGGAYSNGTVTDPLTHGQRLAAAGDVVVVSVNHRLNALGYAWLKPLGDRFADSGNLGQLDLILALEWVRDNIASFGGNPARVMVFGQSGGGAKIATLMAMPAAKGLFHTAATMSGQQVTASGPGNAWKRTQALMTALGLQPSDADGLLSAPVERIVEALTATDPVIGGAVYFGPVLDMTNLPRHPFWPDAASQSLHIPMILGNTREETRAFLDPRGAKLKGLGWDNIAAKIAPEIKIDLDVDWVVAQYRAQFPDWTPEQLFYAATTAGRSWPGQVIEADERAKAGAAATWVYQLDRASPIDPLRGAAHTDDIPYVFGTLDAPGSMSGTDAGARATRDVMMQAFAGLAKTGVPGRTDWSSYALPDRATLVVGNGVATVQNDPRRWERELWARAPYVQPGS
ncbi:carboxylesterase/lipase family protein [Blastomonas aquatica]|uniref:Carboxylic ester hydrolase n=1 Tax=Blastomonas aquatica TaxID=1510276 RepID=A0ABQ1JNI0_9SPHN|nr:carboxylesterase family protein [Blastomonas aquatica]GGB71530.1 carboxylic ester hydrolase [Blastomonas aquatica]